MYYVALRFDTEPTGTLQLPLWHIESPWRLSNETSLTPHQALVLSRRNAVDLSTLCSAILLIHVYTSHWFEWRHRKYHKVSEGERGSVPRSEARKGWLYIAFTFLVCAVLLGLRFALDGAQVSLWRREFQKPSFSPNVLTNEFQIYRTGMSLQVLSFSSFRSTSLPDSHIAVSRLANLAWWYLAPPRCSWNWPI